MKKNNKYTNNTNEFLKKKSKIRTSNLLHSTHTLYLLSYFGRYDLLFKCNR